MGFSSARNLGRDISAGFSPPRRMPISEAVKKFMRVPKGAGNSVPWDPELTPYIIEPMNCLASREYDAVIFVGPARTGKTIGLIDGWIVYTIVCDPSDMLVVQMAVLDGKSVTFNGQQMTMENLSEIRQGRQEWERRLAALITRRRGHPGYRLARF
ncbi:phage terminase large subunit family protein [Escherichia coli]|uniref:phage terminase large subunit family protein n=5 Tax=Enterobacteriaceae TaxID=543 RepID=UPI0038914104